MNSLQLIAMAQETEHPFYTVAEAARMLEVSPSTIWRWIEAERLPAYRVGPRRIRLRKEDLEKVIQPVQREVRTMEREKKHQDIFRRYDPARARQALQDSAGALANVDRQQLLADLRAQRQQASVGRPA